MRGWKWTAMLLLMLAPLMGAQNLGAPHPDAANATLYVHSDDGATGWMNTLLEDGAQATFCPGSTTGTPIGDLCPQEGASFEWDIPLTPGLSQDLLLDAAGTVDFSIEFGGNCCTAGTVSLAVKLVSGGTTVAESSGTHNMVPQPANENTGGSGASTYTDSIAPAVERIAASDGLNLIVSGSGGSWSHATMYTRGNTFVTLPITGTEAPAGAEAPTDDVPAEDPTGEAPEEESTEEEPANQESAAEEESAHEEHGEETQEADSATEGSKYPAAVPAGEPMKMYGGIHIAWYIIGAIVLVALVVPAAARK